MDAFTIATALLALAERASSLYLKFRANAGALGELTQAQSDLLDAQAASLFAAPHWQPSTPPPADPPANP